MNRILLLSLVLLTAPLVGCADGGPGDEGYTIEWDQEPGDRDAGQSTQMSWTVDGPESQIPHTAVHWADRSVDDPTSPADYGNTTDAVEPADVPGTFSAEITFDEPGTYYVVAHAIVNEDENIWTDEAEVQVDEGDDPTQVGIQVQIEEHTEETAAQENITFEWSLSGTPDEVDSTQVYWGSNSSPEDPTPGDYDNHDGTVDDASVPGTYNTTFTHAEPGVYHARAHALHSGSHYWSQEVSFEVTEAQETENHTVQILGITNGYDPDELTVQQGDTITWENTDSLTHTVTFDNETLGDSGDIEPGQEYDLTIPTDLEPGTYEYICTYHDTTMTAQITVEANS